ncbi:DUF1491 family protein [Roseococcus sp. YIM B11640]|uniref:DUF1491 family protein n=1 Tax=Roseococcus sp. YIM B11640 TaxID=3133973 RepID=UPI003C7AE4E0
MDAKVKAHIWVSMAIRMSDMAGRPAAVLRKGDPDSGGLICVLEGREGQMVLAQARDMEGRPAWVRGTGPAPVGREEADAYIQRQVKRDPDVWVIEFEAPDYLPPFEARLI